MGVAVSLALAPLPVRGQEVESVRGGHRPRHARLVVAHVEERSRSSDRYRSRRGSSRSRRDRSWSSDRYRSRRDRSRRERSRSVDRSRSRRERAHSPARRGERRDRSRSHASPSRSVDRSRSMERLPAPSARLRDDGAGRLARRGTQEGVEAVASQPPVAPGGAVDCHSWCRRGIHDRSPVCYEGACQVLFEPVWLLFPGSVWRLCGSDRFWSSVGGSCGSLFVCFWSGHFLWYGCAACWSWRFA